MVSGVGHGVDTQSQQVRQRRTDDPEGQPEHQRHNADKAGQGGVLAGQDLIHSHAALVLAAFTGAHHGLVAQALDKSKAHVSQGSLAVQAGLVFQLGDGIVQLQSSFDQLITLHQLGGGKPQWQTGVLGVVLNQVGHGVDAAVYRAVLAIGGIAEIDAAGDLAVAGHMQGMLHQLVDALVLGGRDGHHRHTQQFLQFVDHDGAAIGAHFVHHIQRQHHRNLQFHQLHG